MRVADRLTGDDLSSVRKGPNMHRWAGRAAAVLACMIGAVTVAGAAFAHVEVSAEPAVAGATNAVVTFDAEAESSTAGIKSVRIVLPAGIAPSDVALKKGPSGWTLRKTADGYMVAGKALAKGKPAVHSITVARMPAERRLVFKALVTYSDDAVDRWIEEPTTANPNPDNPAPVLQLKPAPATTAPATTAPATTAPVVTASVSAAADAPPDSDSAGRAWLWWLLGAAVILAVATATVAAVRRRRAGARSTPG
jgi:uncharacterized protein YcnI